MDPLPDRYSQPNCGNDPNCPPGHAGPDMRETANHPLGQRICLFLARSLAEPGTPLDRQRPLQAIALPDPVDYPPIDDQPPSRVSR